CPCLARDRDRFLQVVVAVTLQHDAGDRQAVPVVERVVAIAVSAPPPTAQTMASWSVARGAGFEERHLRHLAREGGALGRPITESRTETVGGNVPVTHVGSERVLPLLPVLRVPPPCFVGVDVCACAIRKCHRFCGLDGSRPALLVARRNGV